MWKKENCSSLVHRNELGDCGNHTLATHWFNVGLLIRFVFKSYLFLGRNYYSPCISTCRGGLSHRNVLACSISYDVRRSYGTPLPLSLSQILGQWTRLRRISFEFWVFLGFTLFSINLTTSTFSKCKLIMFKEMWFT